MANVIEVVTRLRDDLSGQLTAQADKVRAFNRSLHDLALVSAPLLAVTGAMTAMFIATARLSDQVEQLGRISRATGISIEDLSILRQIFSEAGVAADAATPAFRIFAAALRSGDLREYGINASTLMGGLKQLSATFAGMKDGPEKLDLATRALGRGSIDLVAVIEDLNGKFDEQAAAVRAAGVAIDEHRQKVLTEFDTQLDLTKRNIAGFTTTTLSIFAQWSSGILRDINDVTVALRDLSPSVKTDALGALAASLVGPKMASAHGAIPGLMAGHGSGIDPFGFQTGASSPFDQEAFVARLKERNKAVEEGLRLQTLVGNAAILQPDTRLRGMGFEMPRIGGELQGKTMDSNRLTEMAIANLTKVQALGQSVAQTMVGVFQSVAVAVVNGSMGVAEGIKAIFSGMVQAIISELARLAAIQLFKFLLGAMGIPLPAGFGGSSATAGFGGASTGLMGGNTYVIQTFDSRSTLDSLVSVGGPFRGATDRLQVLAGIP